MDNKKLYLPKHRPSENVWSAIENELNNQDAIDSLPQHSPSDAIWNQIEKHHKKNILLTLPAWTKVAASILLIVGVGALLTLLNAEPTNNTTITYSEEWIEPMDTENWNIEEDQNIALLIEQKEMESPLLLKSEEYKLLKEEYINLIDSKKLILDEVNPFTENVELELILTRIELEKSSIVRSLISFHVA
jgi:hypothetical protein